MLYLRAASSAPKCVLLNSLATTCFSGLLKCIHNKMLCVVLTAVAIDTQCALQHRDDACRKMFLDARTVPQQPNTIQQTAHDCEDQILWTVWGSARFHYNALFITISSQETMHLKDCLPDQRYSCV